MAVRSYMSQGTQSQIGTPSIEDSATRIKDSNEKDGAVIYKALKFAAHRYIRDLTKHPEYQQLAA